MSEREIQHLNTIIRQRRSIFPNAFQPGEIADEAILALLENANWAPTHKKTEPWRFIVLRGKALDQLGLFLAEDYKATTDEDRFSLKKYEKKRTNPVRSSAVIAICMQRDAAERIPEWEEVAAVACAVQNLWLTATAMGLGGYWSTPSAMTGNPDILALGEGQRCLGIFYLGIPRDAGPDSQRTPVKSKVTWLNELPG